MNKTERESLELLLNEIHDRRKEAIARKAGDRDFGRSELCAEEQGRIVENYSIESLIRYYFGLKRGLGADDKSKKGDSNENLNSSQLLPF